MKWKKKRVDAGVPQVCVVCGVDATKGYTYRFRRYCDTHFEEALRRETREGTVGSHSPIRRKGFGH